MRKRAKGRKKGIVIEMGTAIFWMVFLSMQLMSIVLLSRMIIRNSFDMRYMESRVFINKAFYSPYGTTYYDYELGRVYPNIIDFSKFTTEHIESAIYYPDSFKIGMKLVLYDLDGKELNRIFMNEDAFFSEKYAVLGSRLVIIDNGGTRQPGILKVFVA